LPIWAVFPFNCSFVWQYDECDASTIAGYGYNLIVQQSVDVLIAPPCPNADIAAIIGTTYNIPLLMYGNTMASKLVFGEKKNKIN
jgi:hypothetical protein